MGKVILDMAMSLDGFIAGLNDEDGGLHNWYFAPANDNDDPNKQIIDGLINSIGAIVMGRRSYEMGNQFDGYVDNPYKVPHIILTHQPPQTLPKGETEFTFVTDGIQSAITQAIAAAGDKDVVIGGGANITQQALKAGLVDEICIHLIPVLLGEGIRLFDKTLTEIEVTQVIPTPNVTHISYRVIKKDEA